MGDMADDLVASFFDVDYDADTLGDLERKPPSCKYCGKQNLHWVDTARGWRLFNPSGTMHFCDMHPSVLIGKPTPPPTVLCRESESFRSLPENRTTKRAKIVRRVLRFFKYVFSD